MAEDQKKYEKPKNRKGVILRLGRYMMQYKFFLLSALILTIGSNLLALMGPIMVYRLLQTVVLSSQEIL